MPRARAVVPVSAMEQAGYQDVLTADLIEKNGYKELMVNPVIYSFGRWIDALVSGLVSVIDRVGGGRGYAQSPFLLIKVSILTRSIMAQGIADPVLEERAVRFYQDDFWPAAQDMVPGSEGLWPGHPDVTPHYKEAARSKWEALRDEIYAAMNKDDLFDRMFERFYAGRVDKDEVVRAVLAREMLLKRNRYTFMAYAARHQIWQDKGSRADVDIPGVVFPAKIMQVLPFIQGGALFLIHSMLPVFLTVVCLSRRMMPLVMFSSVLVSIKLWTLGWCIVDKASMVWFLVGHAGVFGLSPAACMWIAGTALLIPAVITWGMVWVMLKIKWNGFS